MKSLEQKDNRKVQKLWLAYFRQGNNDNRCY